MLRFGKINSADPETGRYRVEFADDQLVTAPLPCVTVNSLLNKAENPLDIGEPVVVIMDENCEEGIILGAYNDKDNVPVFANQDQSGITYKDNSFIKYDRDAKKFTASFEGDADIIKATNINYTFSGTFKLNNGANGGIPMTPQTISRLNLIENKINAILAAFTTWVPASGDGGAALKALVTVPPVSPALSLSVPSDIENPDFEQ